MGTVFPRQSDNMKLIAVLALAAVAFAEPEAEAEADPWYTYGYGHPYAGVYGGYRAYGAYPYAYGYYGKRSAEAEPEAEVDPALLYGAYGYGYPGVYGGYRTYGAYPYAYGNRFVYGKRSAEAEPEAEADPALLYTSSVAGGLVSPVLQPLHSPRGLCGCSPDHLHPRRRRPRCQVCRLQPCDLHRSSCGLPWCHLRQEVC